MNQLDTPTKTRSPKFSLKGKGSKSKLLVIVMLALICAIAAIPAYFKGNFASFSIGGIPIPGWEVKAPWSEPFPVKNLGEIRSLKGEGIDVPQWETIEKGELQIGGHKWTGQVLRQSDNKGATLFVFPQNGPKEQPGVEWVDMQGFFKWNIDSQRTLKFTAETEEKKATVKARFLLAREGRNSAFGRPQTVAVLQWYAWDDGGHFSPVNWFWLDQRAQVKRDRVPWVAINLRIPVDPKSTLDSVESEVKSLASTIQTQLMQEVFAIDKES